MSHNLNRRSVIAGIAGAVPAAAVGAVPSLALHNTDAIPAGLVAQFDEWIVALSKWKITQRMESDAVDKLMEKRGWSKDTFDRARQQVMNGDERLLIEWQQASARAYREVMSPERFHSTEGGGDQDLTDIQDALWEISYEILGFEPKTLNDLAVQARAARYIESEWFEEPDLPPHDEYGCYTDGYAGRRLTENILRMVGQATGAA